MGYIGRGLNTGQYRKLDSISFDGSATSYSLTVNSTAVTPSSQNCLLSINGVVQEPFEAFSVTGSIVNFSTAPASDATFFGIIMGEAAFIAGNTVGQNELAASEDIANYIGSAISGSFTTVSSSLASRLTTEEGEAEGSVISSSAQIAADISGSFTAASSSISTRITSNDDDMTLATASIASNESNMTLATASIAAITASISTAKTDISTNSANMTLATASIAAITASVSTLKSNVGQELNTDSAVTFATVDTGQGANELYDMDQNVLTTSSPTFAGVTATGTITAQEFQTQFVSASIIYQSGSTKFGDTTDDIHQFTGSLAVTGSNLTITTGGNVSGSVTSTGSFGRVEATNYSGDGSALTGISIPSAADISGSFEGGGSTNISGSSTSTGSFGSVHTAGNVGIGTTDPTYPLMVEGSGEQLCYFRSTDTIGGFRFGDNSGTSGLFGTNGDTYFTTGGATATANALLYIKSDGKVGIGEVSPTTDLQITNASHAIITCKTSDNTIQFGGASQNKFFVGVGGSDRLLIDSSGNVQFPAYGSGTLSTDASGNITTSDERLKDKTRNLEAGLDLVRQLSPIFFKWKKDSGLDQAIIQEETEEQEEIKEYQGTEHLGFVAQEIQAVIPEAAHSPRDPNRPLNYEDRALIAVLVKAIQELSAKVEALENA